MAEQKAEDRGGKKGADGLSDDETKKVAERQAGSPKVVHEVIRLQGDEELDRPIASLLFSGFAGGVSVSSSLLAQSFLKMHLPEAPWATLVSSLGYTLGFVIVIMGNLQLFTESTVTAVLPVATRPSWRNVGRLFRLWGVVLAANLLGTLLVAFLIARQFIVTPEQFGATVRMAHDALDHDATMTLLLGMPAGFLVASIAWILPNARGGSEFWIIVAISYLIAIGGYTHVVLGSNEAWLAWLTGGISFDQAVLRHMAPALIGNIIGGTGLFAVVAHGQVRSEMDVAGEEKNRDEGRDGGSS